MLAPCDLASSVWLAKRPKALTRCSASLKWQDDLLGEHYFNLLLSKVASSKANQVMEAESARLSSKMVACSASWRQAFQAKPCEMRSHSNFQSPLPAFPLEEAAVAGVAVFHLLQPKLPFALAKAPELASKDAPFLPRTMSFREEDTVF